MAQFNSKNKYNFWHSPIVLLVLFCILILFVYNIIGLLEKERETANKRKLEEVRLESQYKREESLIMDIAKLKTDEGVEETIREKFQVVKEGEKMVVIVEPEQKSLVEPTKVIQDNSFWGWVKRTLRIDK